MQTGWVLLYFLLACAALGVLVFPAGLEAAWRRLARMSSFAQAAASRAGWRRWHQVQGQGLQAASDARASLAAAHQGFKARWPWLLLAMALLLVPMLLVVLGRDQVPRVLDGYDDRIDPANQHVSKLLQGEQLVPPPALPPTLFASAEVAFDRPMLATADRRWDQMDIDFVQRILLAFKIMKEDHGYDMALLEGWRSPDRQNLLAARGANVTMAGAWQSYHQYGLAADCAFYRAGKLVISEKDPWAMRGYQLYGEVAERLGLTWGGRWQMMDLGHVEWRKPGAKDAMKAARYR
jgi:peptidoglycan L-alanyl-D-glutamate endopeptidase CwlK